MRRVWRRRFKLRAMIIGALKTMDIIFIRDLRIETLIGVHAWEREAMRTLLIDLELGTDIRPAARSDQLEQTLDYAKVAQRIKECAAQWDDQLIESLGERVAELVLREFGVGWLRLCVRKPGALADAGEVGILIERGKPF